MTAIELINNNFVIAVLSALFAVFFKHFYDEYFATKRLRKKEKLLVNIIDNIILVNLRRHIESYNELLRVYKKSCDRSERPSLWFISSLDSNLLELFPDTELYDILSKRDIDYSTVFEAFHDLDDYQNYLSPQNLEKEFINDIISIRANHKITQLSEISNKRLEFNIVVKSQIENIEVIVKTFEDIKMKLKN